MTSQPAGSDADGDRPAEVDQPGLSELREAVAGYAARMAPGPPKLRQDGLAGLNGAISSVPDGMASGLLAGVNPIYGLYACTVGPIVGGLFSSTHLMLVTTTSAASLAAGQALAGVPNDARNRTLFLMVMIIGLLQIVFGLLRLGRYTRFVSYSVMTGFLAGIAVLTVVSQLPTVTGARAEGSNKIAQTLDLLLHLNRVHLTSLALAVLTLILALTLPRTRLGNFGVLAAIATASLVVALFSLRGVEIVEDVGPIPHGLPALFWPSFSDLSPDVLSGGLAVAVIILVQGAGVSQSVPNADGTRSRASQDFVGQGAANLMAGVFRGLPVGGSLSATAINVLSGARTRWASIFAGVWVGVIVLVFPGLVSRVAMPALGALLILAGVSTIKPRDALSVWQTGWPSRLAGAATFLSTLLLPIQVAVAIGVTLSALMYLHQSSTDITLVELVERPDGRIEERRAPDRLPANRVTVLDIYGPLFYAAARTLQRMLPKPQDAHGTVVVLRLRGRTTIGATLLDVLADYADKLTNAGGQLYLTGISREARDQLDRVDKLGPSGSVRIYEATPIVGQSTGKAYADGRTWLVDAAGTDPSGDGTRQEEHDA